ncbi:AMP-binding protein [Nocardia sp. BMG111209]|uniref:AMP-binding protein n=1 Tax=Nocardia sp. BMG111209 TaxID=1160137 RepID=UPI00036F1624|nr:AMP-binding protein [Nocardia sp. BMG111209]
MRTIPEELAEKYVAEGWWTSDTLGELLAAGLAATPDNVFEVHSDTRPYQGTYRDVELVARRLAAGLHARGVGPGDVVVFQLPNWMEAAASFWAAALLGTVIVPIVHIYGRKEVSYILETVRPKVFLRAESFGNRVYDDDLDAGVPIVGVVGRDFDDLLADEPMAGVLHTDPACPAVIAFTSGTTSNPKGVVHSHQTLGFETFQLAERYPDDYDRQLTGAPVGHFIGMLNALLIPVRRGWPIHLLDVWNPGRVLELMSTRDVIVGGGVPYYMTSLLDHPDFTRDHLVNMKYAGMGGAAVPVAVTERLTELGITVFRAYGTTEHPSITASWYTAPAAKRLYTDGNVSTGVEIRLSEEGEIISRGPDLCLGYVDDELTAKMFDDEGWYHTGDIGVLDEDGYLTITDRKSDVIIRGGENISALEVEEALLGMSGIAEVAVVSAPDARLGERAAAVVRLLPGAELPTLDQVREHFANKGLAKQKWPEEILAVADFPRTASGKIQKFRIRETLRQREQ